MHRRPPLGWDTWLGPTVLTLECQSATIWHFGTQLRLALGTLALSSVWHLALWHSAPFGTWHFGTQLRLALGTLALESILVIHSLAPPNSSIAFARIGTIWVTKHSEEIPADE